MLQRKEASAHLIRARTLTTLLDSQFSILGFRFGFDPLINLVPFLGGSFTALLSFYLVWIGIQIGLPGSKISQMIVNIIIDYSFEFIPILGNFADFVYKSNIKNMEILEHYFEQDERVIEGEVVEG